MMSSTGFRSSVAGEGGVSGKEKVGMRRKTKTHKSLMLIFMEVIFMRADERASPLCGFRCSRILLGANTAPHFIEFLTQYERSSQHRIA